MISDMGAPNRSRRKSARVRGIQLARTLHAPRHNHRREERKEKRDTRRMSYSFREPEDPAICECKYDPIHDRMDREDCPFHLDLEDAQELPVKRKAPRIAEAEETGARGAKTA